MTIFGRKLVSWWLKQFLRNWLICLLLGTVINAFVRPKIPNSLKKVTFCWTPNKNYEVLVEYNPTNNCTQKFWRRCSKQHIKGHLNKTAIFEIYPIFIIKSFTKENENLKTKVRNNNNKAAFKTSNLLEKRKKWYKIKIDQFECLVIIELSCCWFPKVYFGHSLRVLSVVSAHHLTFFTEPILDWIHFWNPYI